MSALHVPARARKRLVVVLVTALVAALAALGLTPVPANAADPTLSFVAAASSAGNRTSHTVRVPGTVQAGDTLLVFLTTASLSPTLDNPAGWTLLQSKDGAATRGRAWTKKATAVDVDAAVTVTSSALVKSAMSISAYRSTAGTSAVTASDSIAGTTSTTTHVAPDVDVAQAGSWLVTSWSERSSTDSTWTPPGNSTSRATAAATGGGKVSSLLADSNAAVPTGNAAGRTATTSLVGGGTQLFSVVISPGAGTTTPPGNQAPIPSFTASCAGLTCSFDASATTDPDNNPLTYAWNFGDGATGTGVATSRTYASAGARTVTLTVGDGTTTAQTTRSATPIAPVPGGPGHTALVPETPRTDMPKIANGEIWDIEILGNRVFIAGTFTTIQNQRSGNTTTYTRNGIASYNMSTGLVDTGFNPKLAGGGVDSVEITPDGTKLYITGSFSSVNGTTRRGLASLNLTTGAPVAGFVANLSARGSELAVTNSTVYVGGRFTKVNNVERVSLAAVNATTGAVDSGFVNNLSGGLGVGGALTVQRLVLTRDLSRLLVVHTGRQVAGQDRYGIALINTATKQLLPWRTRLWQDNLQFVGGIQRIFGAAIAPDDTWFAVTSGSGGDRPPINDTVVAFSIEGGDNVQPRWITRCFDSIYSIAISEKAVYIGGHFAWNESPTAPDPWPGLDDVGYGTGQGLSGYALGDAVVNREHLGALNPVDGKALEWNPGSNSYEGNKAMEITPRGLFTGGDATTQGGANIGRIAFYDFSSVPASNGVETAITEPINGRVNPSAEQWLVKGTAQVPSGSVARAELEVIDRANNRYLADNLTTWSTTANTINTTLQSTGARTANWSLPLTITGNRKLTLRARTVSSTGVADATKATKKTETFGLSDQPPNTNVTGPSTTLVKTMTYTVTGTATDDVGVNSIGMTIRDGSNRYLQADGSVSSTGYTFRFAPDVVGATNTTWSKEITVPVEGTWKAQARATDTTGQADLDTADRQWIVSEDGAAPNVSISSPATMVPPTAAQPLVVAPGGPLTFSGSANDDGTLNSVEISLRNSTTRENLAADGTWSTDVNPGWHRVSPINLSASSHNWSYNTPFNLKPGSYSFAVRATDDLGLTTSSANQGKLTINAQVPGDAPPDGKLNVTGTVTGGQSLHLDLAGTATDDKGVAAVRVSLFDGDTSKYLQANGTLATAYATLPAVVTPGNALSANWTLGVDLPQGGDWNVTAFAFDTVNQQDTSTAGATARYRIYPGDVAPTLTENLLAPTEGTTFSDGRIFVSGRAEDDQAMQRVEVAIVDSQGRYMNSSGAFPNTTASWRTAFLTSPGTPGSNFSYTSPVVPPGAYTVLVRGMDNHDQVTAVPSERHITVTHPPGNTAPVANFTVSCNQNVCTYDGRSSTDENAATLSYAWNYGNGVGSGPLPTRTYTSANTYTVTLTVTDEWGIPSAQVSKTVTITEPANNAAPTPVINPPACSGLVCNFSGVGSADSNTGDSFTYLWDFGDLTPTSTSTSPSHTFGAAGSYTVKLTTTDGWGKASSTTRLVTVSTP
jgi:PKD repeat protein